MAWWKRLVSGLASVVLAGVVAGCGGGSPVALGADAQGKLADAGKQTLGAKSSRFSGTYSIAGGAEMRTQGILSWSTGTNAEFSMNGMLGSGTTTARITDDAMYSTMPPEMGSMLRGKKWLRQSYDSMVQQYGPMGEVIRAAFTQTYPARSLAMLRQAGDLKELGTEQRNGQETTHYAGTIDPHKLIADLQLGLTEDVLRQLREEIPNAAPERLDVWVNEQGYPVRAEGSSGDQRMAVDYTDYGGPVAITAPPASEVMDADELRRNAGLLIPR